MTDKASILVVDDLPDKRLAYETVLADLDENIVLVSSGAEALKELLQRPFAVILLDVNMPDMDGFETARLIRRHRRTSTIPIIFLTAFADEVRTAEGYATGAVDYLPTPIVPEILRAKVRVFVELYKMRQQMAQRAEETARHAAAEDANRRLAFLANAGAVLGQSLDYQTTARDIVRLPIPFLADASLLFDERTSGTVVPPLRARLSPQGTYLIDDNVALETLPRFVLDAVRRVTESGLSRVITRPTPGESPYEFNTAVALALPARGRTFSVLVLLRSGSRDEISPQDLTLGSALASRAAVALDNALLYEELQKADRQKNDFLSMLAHELRNPLAPICNAVELFRLIAADNEDILSTCDIVDRQISQMVRLVDDLLDVSRITSGKIRLQMEPVDLAAVVSQAVETCQPLIDARGHQLHVTGPEPSVWVEGDQMRLTQAVTNLLNNAAKYMDEGGKIWLTTRIINGEAVITVRDTGVGIPGDMLDTVFNLFTQLGRTLDRSQGGLGIGLTLVKRLVEMHGGRVAARSDGTGHGAEFSLTLPLLEHTDGVLSEASPSAFKTDPTAGKLLVIDDNVDSANTLAQLLRLVGHEVEVAYDGMTGLAAARSFEPDAVLLDIGLPGMDGYEVATAMRKLDSTSQSLLIAISGYGQKTDEERSRNAGFDYHLVKPVELIALRSLLSATPALSGQAKNADC